MDTIRIFSRFDFENAPAVAVMGDVRNPGTYRRQGRFVWLTRFIWPAGLAPDAQIVDAQVIRYMPDGQFKIFSVGLSQALAGNPVENIVLEPRDRLLVHKNPNASNRQRSTSKEKVVKPGRYPLTTNLRVADLIHIGGGLKPSADTETADLTEYEWLNEQKLAGEQQQITISAALTGNSKANLPLSQTGDVLDHSSNCPMERSGCHDYV